MLIFRLTWNEFKKDFFQTSSYLFQWIGEIVSLLFFYLFLSSISVQSDYSGLGYCIWFYSFLLIGDTSGKIAGEMRLGTFEQIYLSNYSLPILFFAKALASVMRAILLAICLIVLLLLSRYITATQLMNPVLALMVVAITPGLFGIGLCISGMTLYFKDVGWINNLINNGLLFLSGTFFPLTDLPLWLKALAKFIPTSRAVFAIRQNELDFHFFTMTLLISLIYLLMGVKVFQLFENKAKITGVLGHH